MKHSKAQKFTVFFLSFLLLTGVSYIFPDDSEARKVRNNTRTKVHNNNRNVNRNKNVNRNVNRNTNINRNVNRNNNVNINRHRDIDIDVDVDYRRRYNPVATAVGVAATAAVIGSIVYSLPPSCQRVAYNGFTYQQCGSTWYEPQYRGNQVTYVVINPPY